jgi:hypothetical protein
MRFGYRRCRSDQNRASFWIFLLIVFALPILPGPVAVAEYWITLLNYIGLYSIVAIHCSCVSRQ